MTSEETEKPIRNFKSIRIKIISTVYPHIAYLIASDFTIGRAFTSISAISGSTWAPKTSMIFIPGFNSPTPCALDIPIAETARTRCKAASFDLQLAVDCW